VYKCILGFRCVNFMLCGVRRSVLLEIGGKHPETPLSQRSEGRNVFIDFLLCQAYCLGLLFVQYHTLRVTVCFRICVTLFMPGHFPAGFL
jgi:hypothetical protein